MNSKEKTYDVVALLPIKANSERVKGKNFRMLGDKPLYRWILDSLLAVNQVDLVVINTDSEMLLSDENLRLNERVLIRSRPEEIRGDLVSMNLVIQNDLDNVSANTYVMTHATNPLLSSDTIAAALSEYGMSDDHDSLFTVNRFQTRFYKADGTAINHDPKNLIRTQDLEPWFEENSCLYVFSEDSFKKTGARIGERPLMFETPHLESIDIDEEADWDHVSALVKNLEGA